MISGRITRVSRQRAWDQKNGDNIAPPVTIPSLRGGLGGLTDYVLCFKVWDARGANRPLPTPNYGETPVLLGRAGLLQSALLKLLKQGLRKNEESIVHNHNWGLYPRAKNEMWIPGPPLKSQSPRRLSLSFLPCSFPKSPFSETIGSRAKLLGSCVSGKASAHLKPFATDQSVVSGHCFDDKSWCTMTWRHWCQLWTSINTPFLQFFIQSLFESDADLAKHPFSAWILTGVPNPSSYVYITCPSFC